MEHKVEFKAGYDCIKFQCIHGSVRCFPGSGGSHGKHGMNIRFLSKGEKGVVQFLLYTGWLPLKTHDQNIEFLFSPVNPPLPADLGYHSPKPLYEDHYQTKDACEYLEGKPCYYDGSTLNAGNAMYTLLNGGEDALWKFLDEYYLHIFEGGPYPRAAEYPKQPR